MMNEQFQTLFDKVNLPYAEGDSAYTVTGSDLQMFAELIVRECAQKGFDVFDEEPDATGDAARYYVRDKIKEYFGVEE